MRERVLKEPKIEVRTNFTATSFDGNVLEQTDGPSLIVDGIFVAIGYRTNTDYIDAVTSEGRLFTDINLNILSFNLSITHIFRLIRLLTFFQLSIFLQKLLMMQYHQRMMHTQS